MSARNLANAVENMNRTRIDATGNRLRLKDGERLSPKSWSGSSSLAGFARETAAWLGCVDPKHEAGKLRQQEGRKEGRVRQGLLCLLRWLVRFFQFCFSVNIVAVWDESFPSSCFVLPCFVCKVEGQKEDFCLLVQELSLRTRQHVESDFSMRVEGGVELC